MWRNKDGKPFPFADYNRIAHLGGLNFVGTSVLLSDDALSTLRDTDTVLEFNEALRMLAGAGHSFHAIDVVTYVRS